MATETEDSLARLCDRQSEKIKELSRNKTDLLAACKAQHEAIDRLFAMMIVADPNFKPTRSGQPWVACVQGNDAIKSIDAT